MLYRIRSAYCYKNSGYDLPIMKKEYDDWHYTGRMVRPIVGTKLLYLKEFDKFHNLCLCGEDIVVIDKSWLFTIA